MAESMWAPGPRSRTHSERYVADTHPHPYLLYPRLWLIDHPPEIPDSVLANGPLKPFRPIKICINRDSPEALDGGGTSGTIEFQSFHSAEKALATISSISLSINPPGDYQPPCSATPLWIRNLPDGIDEGDLFDLFRPFGPLHSVRFIVQGPRDDVLGTAKVLYLREESSRLARSTMDGTEVQGKTIGVIAESTPPAPPAPTTPRESTTVAHRSSPMRATAPPFVPRNSPHASPRVRQPPPSLPATPPQRVQQEGFNALWTSPSFTPMVPVPAQLHPINGPTLPVPGTNLRYSPTQATYIDPCNLYCKNLEHTIDDDALVAIFQDFGEVISARVITNDEQGSRGHGFVSFAHPEEAARALAALNGVIVRGRPMYVRLHEPKQPRKNRLARQFGVGDTSGSDMTGTSNPSQPQTPRSAPSNELRAAVLRERHRSQSSSVDRNLNGRPSGATIDQELLSSLTGPARQSYVSDTMFRHLSVVPAAQNGPTSVGDIAAAMATLDVEEQIRTLADRDLLDERIVDINEGRLAAAPAPSRATTALGLTGVHGLPEDESTADGAPANNGLAIEGLPDSSQEHHVEPATGPASKVDPDEERNQLRSAVTGIVAEGSRVEIITDMVASLSNRDRALCLFNPPYLEGRVRRAERILDIVQGRETPTVQGSNDANGTSLGNHPQPTEGGTNQPQNRSIGTQTEESFFVIPLETLAESNCREIMALVEAANENEATGNGGIHPSELPLGPVIDEQRREAEEMLQSVLQERRHVDQKQRLGDILYAEIKTALRKAKYPSHRGYPGRITIALLEEGIPAGFGEDYDDGEEKPADQSESKDEGNAKTTEATPEGPPEEGAAAGSNGSAAVEADETAEKASEKAPASTSASISAGANASSNGNGSGSGNGNGNDSDDHPPNFLIPPTQQVRRHLDAQKRVLERAEHADHIRCIAQVIALYPDLFRLKVVREAKRLGAKPLKEEE